MALCVMPQQGPFCNVSNLIMHTTVLAKDAQCLSGSWCGRIVYNSQELFPLSKAQQFHNMEYKDH